MKVLVVGGAGYIGSHMVRALVNAGHKTAVFDNLSTGHRSLVPVSARFIKGDLKNPVQTRRALGGLKPDAVMHFAASALVGESVENPFKYYENNVLSCIHLLRAMVENGVRFFIFSSTAATYGEPKRVPIRESDPTSPTNPYGQSKLMIENILKDLAHAGDLSYIALRYFNACGAHPAGETGEVHDPETHLVPNILKVACGKKKELVVFGDDYDTPDGTCIRDYIHVEDLASAHLLALNALRKGAKSGVFNLGNGNGYSVMQIIRAAEKVTGRKIKFKMGPRRPGDPSRLVADAARARRILGWRPRYGLDAIVESAWKWELRSSSGQQLRLRHQFFQ